MTSLVLVILSLGALAALPVSTVLAAPQQHLPARSLEIVRHGPEVADDILRRRWSVEWETAERPAMYCALPAEQMDNFGESADEDRPLYDDCWSLGIEQSINPRKFTVGDWAGTDGCGIMGSNGTCAICVGRLDGEDNEVVVGSEDIANALMPVSMIYHDGNYTGGTAKMDCPDAQLLWQVRHVKYIDEEQ